MFGVSIFSMDKGGDASANISICTEQRERGCVVRGERPAWAGCKILSEFGGGLGGIRGKPRF